MSIFQNQWFAGVAIYGFSVAVLLVWFSFALYADRYIQDIDGDSAYSFPIHGQDSPAFAALGERIARGEGFTTEAGTPEVFRTPGYPALLALSYYLSDGPFLAVVIQIAMAAGIVLLTYYIGFSFSGFLGGILGAGLMLFSPNLLGHSSVLLSDIPAVFLVLASVYLLFFTPARIDTALGGGVLLGIAALMRPVALYMPIVILPFLIYRLYQTEEGRRIIAILAVMVAGFLACILPWYVRNALETGTFGFSTIVLYNAASYNIPQFLREQYGGESSEYREYREAFDSIGTSFARSFEGADTVRALAYPVLLDHPFAYGTYHLVESLKFFLSSSVRYVVLHIQSESIQRFFGLTASSPDLLSLVRSGEWTGVLEALRSQAIITTDRVFTAVIMVLAFAALLFSRRRFEILLFVVLVGYFAFATGPVSIPRYRLPAEPFVIVLAVYTCLVVWNYIQARVVIARHTPPI